MSDVIISKEYINYKKYLLLKILLQMTAI